MSFNSLSPEVMMKIFSHLLDVPTKIRLERVSKKFRDCVHNGNSWMNNTELEIDNTTSMEELRPYLSHTHVITKLSLFDCRDADILACLFSFGCKLKVTHFAYRSVVDPKECTKNKQIVACCLGKFSQSLTSANLLCCCESRCDVLNVFVSVLPLCKNLQHLSLSNINDDEGQEGPQEEPLFILNSLQNLPLRSFRLDSFFAPDLSAERLAAVCNSAKDHALSSLTIDGGYENVFGRLGFRLDKFCNALEPAAAHAVQTLKLIYLYTNWEIVMPKLPALMPNLSNITIEEVLYSNASTDQALNKARSLGAFMHSCLGRKNNIVLELNLEECPTKFSNRFWNAIDLVAVAHSGTKRRQDTDRWKRTLHNGCATINIDLR